MEVKFTIQELESLLLQQKKLVIEKLLSHTYVYNTESTDGHLMPMKNINEEKFKEWGNKADFPNDFKVLKRHIPIK